MILPRRVSALCDLVNPTLDDVAVLDDERFHSHIRSGRRGEASNAGH